MKWNTLIIVVLGLIVVAAAALAILHLSSSPQLAAPPGNATVKATPLPPTVKTNVLELFGTLKQKVTSAGLSYGGAAVQLIDSEETAMVYIYKPVGQSDISGLLTTGFGALYGTFGTQSPLLVGIVDTTQKINAQQYRVDVYALERPVVAEYVTGNVPATEMVTKALLITPESESLHPANSTNVKRSLDLSFERPGNYVVPADRSIAFSQSLNNSGYTRTLGFQAAPLSDGTRAVSVTMPMASNMTTADKYDEIEATLRACVAGYGDYDRYMISLVPTQEGVYDYYYLDTPAAPALAYANGDISQYQLYRAINLTYYTK
ncbi:MAG TPA: hypothetical protein VLT35_07195 [Methanocella sp.]|nr:hypothetical protein [Methanocella sp.]